jgi:hypothetical protein
MSFETRTAMFNTLREHDAMVGSAFTSDFEFENLYSAWVVAGRPPHSWTGYMIHENERRVITLCNQVQEG